MYCHIVLIIEIIWKNFDGFHLDGLMKRVMEVLMSRRFQHFNLIFIGLKYHKNESDC